MKGASRASPVPSGRCCRPMTPQYRAGFCSITGIFGVRRLAAAFESGSKLPHSKSGCERVGSSRYHILERAKPGIRNYNCGTLTKADQFWQTFKPKLDIAKQLGREISRPQLALAQIFPLLRRRVRQTMRLIKRNGILTGLTG